jgi:hypothetical protein
MPLDEAVLEGRVKALLPAARAFAIASLNPVDAEFQIAQKTHGELSNWDFVVSVGGVAVAVSRLFDQVSARQFAQLLPRIVQELDAWDEQGSPALEDCRAFIARSLAGNPAQRQPGHVAIADALGMWILWNLYGHCPSYAESAPARTIGKMLQATFAAWWE